ncbi:uncharacterized protein TrAtP1_000448 [Trichoderma atroviride]|uniref:uncharacterized protein n=1 Tax=Hypocrea atroviridis TaxID=63577 RepID=UPI003323038A|nr:hypothetical protein TrAtP1_000448 [Trichoderma atroviride]
MAQYENSSATAAAHVDLRWDGGDSPLNTSYIHLPPLVCSEAYIHSLSSYLIGRSYRTSSGFIHTTLILAATETRPFAEH